MGRVIEPRKRLSVVADAVEYAEGNIRRVVMAWPFEPTGVREQGTDAIGLPRNLGDPAASSEVNRSGNRNIPSDTCLRAASVRSGANPDAEPEVLDGEGNGAVEDERREVGVSRSTAERGEPLTTGPSGGKGTPADGTAGGNHDGDIELQARVPETSANRDVGA